MINPSDIHAIAAAFQHGRRVVSQRRERAAREHAQAREADRQRNNARTAASLKRAEKTSTPVDSE